MSYFIIYHKRKVDATSGSGKNRVKSKFHANHVKIYLTSYFQSISEFVLSEEQESFTNCVLVKFALKANSC